MVPFTTFRVTSLYSESITVCATDGTPASFTRNSMYGPGGAIRPADGGVIVSPPPETWNASVLSRWLMFMACVVDGSRMMVTFRIDAASAVLTANDCP